MNLINFKLVTIICEPDLKSKIEIVVEPQLALKIMNALAEQFFKNYSLITYSSDISILRPEKFERV